MGTAEQTLIVLAVMAVLFVTEIIPLAITSLGGAITLGLMGIITPKYSLVYLIVQLCCLQACSLLVLHYSTLVWLKKLGKP